MSMKIKISYTKEAEAETVLRLLQPIKGCFRVKKSTGTSPYMHIYFMPKNGEKSARWGMLIDNILWTWYNINEQKYPAHLRAEAIKMRGKSSEKMGFPFFIDFCSSFVFWHYCHSEFFNMCAASQKNAK